MVASIMTFQHLWKRKHSQQTMLFCVFMVTCVAGFLGEHVSGRVMSHQNGIGILCVMCGYDLKGHIVCSVSVEVIMITVTYGWFSSCRTVSSELSMAR